MRCADTLPEYGIVTAALRGGLNQVFSIVVAEGDDANLPGSVKQLLPVLVAETALPMRTSPSWTGS